MQVRGWDIGISLQSLSWVQRCAETPVWLVLVLVLVLGMVLPPDAFLTRIDALRPALQPHKLLS